MELYLVQHGEAEPEAQDPDRPLTDQGAEEVTRVAAAAALAGVRVHQIRHSGRRRAEQTALILAQRLVPPDGSVAVCGLGPKDAVQPVAEQLERETGPLMLVGHLPFLDRLTSLLVTGDPDRSIVRFRHGGIVCLSGEGRDWALAWIITPECVA